MKHEKKTVSLCALSVVHLASACWPACGSGSKAPAASSTSADAAASRSHQHSCFRGTTLKVGAYPRSPRRDPGTWSRPILAEEGINLDIVEFTDYNTPQ